MKSLEHVIREIREDKCACEKKKDSLEHTIRKVGRKEYESSYGAKDSKPVDESDGKLPGNEDKMDEAISVSNPVPTGNQFKSVRTQTPHIKPPGPSHGHSQAPENVSRQRTLAKERTSQTMNHSMHAEETVDEQAAALLPGAALGPVGVAAEVMKSTPAGEKKSEFERQAELKNYNPYKAQGDSISDYEAKYLTPKTYDKPAATSGSAPLPPTRPKYMEDPLKTVHTKGGDYPVFRKGGEAAQDFQSSLKSGSDSWKSPGETGPERKYKTETESGKIKKIKEAIAEKK